MTFFIEPCDELAPQVVQALQQIQQDQGPSTLVSPRCEIITTGQDKYVVVCSVSTLEREADAGYEWGYVPVWQWLEGYFSDH